MGHWNVRDRSECNVTTAARARAASIRRACVKLSFRESGKVSVAGGPEEERPAMPRPVSYWRQLFSRSSNVSKKLKPLRGAPKRPKQFAQLSSLPPLSNPICPLQSFRRGRVLQQRCTEEDVDWMEWGTDGSSKTLLAASVERARAYVSGEYRETDRRLADNLLLTCL